MSAGRTVEVRSGDMDDALPSLRQLHATGFAQLDRTVDAAFRQADPELLELCRWRVAQLLVGDPSATPTSISDRGVELPAAKLAALADWDSSPELSEEEKQHLAVCEQFVTSVAHVSDHQVQALLATRSEQEVYAFVSALYVIELTQRLVLALTRAGGSK